MISVALTVDESTNTLYWINKEKYIVQYINLNSHKVDSLRLPSSAVPSAITIHGENLYFADVNDIRVIHKISGIKERIFRSNTCK